MNPRARRLARGWAGAAMTTSFAAASHVTAGGQVPPLMLVLLSLALSGPLCMALAGRVLSRSSLLAGVVLSQGIFHVLFTITGSVTTVVDTTHHAVAAVSADGPALVLQAQTHTDHDDTAMLSFHLAAAAATYGFMRHGEVAIVDLLQALRLRAYRLWPVLTVPFVAHRPRSAPEGRPHVLTDQSLLRPVRSYRAPPTDRRRILLLPCSPTRRALSPAS